VINIPPDSCENISLAELIGSNVNSCTVSICVAMHMLFTKGRWSGKEINKIETTECRVPFWARVPNVHRPWSHVVVW